MAKVNTHVDGEGYTLTQPAGMGAPPPYGAPPGNIGFLTKNYFLDLLRVFLRDLLPK